jgi:hypothetical protein
VAVISFGESREQIWGGAGWAFRQALKDLHPYVQDDAAVLAVLEEAGHIGYLGVESLELPMRRKVVAAIQEMCEGIVGGEHPSTISETLPDDRQAQDRYGEAIKHLLEMANVAAQHHS